MATQHTDTNWYLNSSTLALDNPRRFTALCRVMNTAMVGGYWGVFSVGVTSGACAQMYMVIDSPGFSFKFAVYNGTSYDESTDVQRTLNVWYDVALVMAANLELWVNGSFVTSIPAVAVGNGIEIGNDAFNTGFTGRLQDVRIYENVALTPREIQLERQSSHPYHASKYKMPFRFLDRQGDNTFTDSDGVRKFALTKTGTSAWAEGYPVGTTRRRTQRSFLASIAGGATNYTRVITDNVAGSDSQQRKSAAFRQPTDNLGLSDAAQRLSALYRQLTDNAALSDTTLRKATSLRQQTDNLALSDAEQHKTTAKRVAADNLGISDAIQRVVAAFRVATDNAGLSDSQQRIAACFRQALDNLGLADSQQRKATSFRQVSDNLALSDAVLRLAGSFRVVADLLGISDAVIALGSGFHILVITDALGISDAAQRKATSNRLAADTLGIPDSVLRRATLLRQASDLLGLSDALQQRSTVARAVTDSLALSDAIQRQVAYARVVTDAVALLETVAALLASGLIDLFPGDIARRALWSWPRVWRYAPMPNQMPVQTLTKTVSEDRDFAFDYSTCPEVVAGAVIDSATILGGTGLTFGATSLNSEEFDDIPIGQAVVVRVSGGVDDTTYPLACKAELDTGADVVIAAKIAVVADYE